MSSYQRLGLLAHELIHCVQYSLINDRHWNPMPGSALAMFVARYAHEYYANPNNYKGSAVKAGTSVSGLDLLDTRYTLDQMAKYVRMDFLGTLGANPIRQNDSSTH